MRLFAAAAPAALLALAACATQPGAAPSTRSSPAGPASVVQAGTDIIINVSTERPASRHLVPAPPERVWSLLPGVYEQLGIPVLTVDPPGLTLGNTRFTFVRRLGDQPGSTFLSCGHTSTGREIADSYRVQLSVRTTLAPAEGGTEARTMVEATARSTQGTSGDPVPCATTGQLETRIARQLLLALAAAQP